MNKWLIDKWLIKKLIGMILKYKSYEDRLIKSNFILTLKIIWLWTKPKQPKTQVS